MGMFDSIKCEYPLPLPDGIEKIKFDIKNVEFQTKDFENLLEKYTIRENGELYRTRQTYKWVDDDNHFLKGYMDVETSEEVKENYHGMLNFYCYEDVVQDDGTCINITIDYIAKFTDGNLAEVEIEKSVFRDITEYKEKTKKFIEESLKENNIWYNKYLLRTRIIIKIKNKIINMFSSWIKFNEYIYYFLVRHL